MSIATVVTRGYGSFGTIAFVVTAGYSIGEAISLVGPITSQAIFKMNKTIGEIGGSETLGIFKEPKDSGRFKP